MSRRFDPRKVESKHHPTIDVHIGDMAMVEPQGVGERFKTPFVGWEMGRYVIFRLPSRLDLREYLYAGKVVIVRYLTCGGEVCGFESEVQGVCYKPQHLFFLDYPERVEVFNLRKENRVDTFLPATLIVSDELSVRASILNISKGGARIGISRKDYDAHPFVIDQQFVCQFQMLGQEAGESTFMGIVRTIIEEYDKVFLGVEFKDISNGLLQRIDEYVKTFSEYSAGVCPPSY